jgi:tetratricopeptide (TPR) repeat protein
VSEHVERLAHHAQRGGLWERAVIYLRQAGGKALAQSASREAAAAFEQALAALAHLPEGGATVEQAIDLRFELRQALQALGEHQRVVDYLREAETFAQECRTRGWQAWALHLLGEISSQHEPPRVTEAQDQYRDALALATSLGMRPLIARCHLGLGRLDRRTGKRHEAQEHLATATAMFREMAMRFWVEQAEAEMRTLGTS